MVAVFDFILFTNHNFTKNYKLPIFLKSVNKPKMLMRRIRLDLFWKIAIFQETFENI